MRYAGLRTIGLRYGGWMLSTIVTLAIVLMSPAVATAICEYGNCTQSYLCSPEFETCSVPELDSSYYDPECGEEGTCFAYY
jgi:hypothetical protein